MFSDDDLDFCFQQMSSGSADIAWFGYSNDISYEFVDSYFEQIAFHTNGTGNFEYLDGILCALLKCLCMKLSRDKLHIAMDQHYHVVLRVHQMFLDHEICRNIYYNGISELLAHDAIVCVTEIKK